MVQPFVGPDFRCVVGRNPSQLMSSTLVLLARLCLFLSLRRLLRLHQLASSFLRRGLRLFHLLLVFRRPICIIEIDIFSSLEMIKLPQAGSTGESQRSARW